MEISSGFNEDLVTELQPVNGSNFNEASASSRIETAHRFMVQAQAKPSGQTGKSSNNEASNSVQLHLHH